MNYWKKIKLINIILIFIATFIYTGCSDEYYYLLQKNDSSSPTRTSKDILTFKLLDSENTALSMDVTGTVNANTVDLTVPNNTNISDLTVDLRINGKTVVPSDGDSVNFSGGSAIFTVTAQDDSTKDYTVTVTFAPVHAKGIQTFDFLAVDNDVLDSDVIGTVGIDTVDLVVPDGTNISALVPDISISGASIIPNDGETVNFSGGPVTFIVTAIDLSTKKYTVTVTLAQ